MNPVYALIGLFQHINLIVIVLLAHFTVVADRLIQLGHYHLIVTVKQKHI